jgi:hypothetical protein
VPAKFNFTYGSAQDKRSAPLTLPEPPQRGAVAETAKPPVAKPQQPKPPAKP